MIRPDPRALPPLAAVAAMAAAAWVAAAAEGPPPPPVLLAADPLGLAPGRAVAVRILGRRLDGVDAVRAWGEGVRAAGIAIDGNSLVVRFDVEPGAGPGVREVRARGPGGWSNPLRLRVDDLEAIPEREPNDAPGDATPIGEESAASGVLALGDVDVYRLAGAPGGPVRVEVEARRLGHPIAPVLAVEDAEGRPLGEFAPDPGRDGDPHGVLSLPVDGHCLIRVHDRLYRGGEHVAYRLRVTRRPYAEGLSRLGGPAGRPLALRAIGGTLPTPRDLVGRPPEQPGWAATLVPDSGAIDFDPPAVRLIAGDAPERPEARDNRADGSELPLVWNGRIGAPGEVDRYTIAVAAGVPICVRVEAAVLGSRLDSVLTVRDEAGRTVAENDDAPSLRGPPERLGLDTADSRVDLIPATAGEWTVEVADRFGEGGPGHAYRLHVGPPPDDFALRLLPAAAVEGTAWDGGFNLASGAEVSVPFRIVAEGRVASIAVRVEGLPRGVSCAPVVVVPGLGPVGATGPPLRSASGILRLRVASGAPRESAGADFRIIGVARLAGAPPLIRPGEAAIAAEGAGPDEPGPPLWRRLETFPIAIVGPSR